MVPTAEHGGATGRSTGLRCLGVREGERAPRERPGDALGAGPLTPVEGSVVTFAGAGCTLTLTRATIGNSIDVNQNGACNEFGAFVDATGEYVRK